jgi:hypothetical protein
MTSSSGGAWGVSAGISSALNTASSHGDASNDESEEREYYATYNVYSFLFAYPQC